MGYFDGPDEVDGIKKVGAFLKGLEKRLGRRSLDGKGAMENLPDEAAACQMKN